MCFRPRRPILSNAPAPTQGTVPVESGPETLGQGEEAREAFLHMMNDDPERAEFLLENTIRVFNELSYTPEECMKRVVSLLRDPTYQWWNTLVSVVPKESYLGIFPRRVPKEEY
ncbi:maturase K [Gossypium australe]|uniref:Maturase K n=1 Tax=Gossypium australe TaxID=47621 RepID=A0A5B6VA92_9ROSI|nr:maturase K [Gossypium australe]